MKRLAIKQFDDNDEQLKWLYENRKELSAQRKSIVKEADSVSMISFAVDEKGERMKAEEIPADVQKLKIRAIINTTNLLDSHKDIHIPGLWKKSLSETKQYYLVNQHVFTFDGILSDEVKAFTKYYDWSELGIEELEGKTQALVFDVILDKGSAWMESAENRKLFNLYKSGKVKNHSVGMRYVKDFFCINSEAYPDEYENWKKYSKYAANQEELEKYNFCWAVTEAKIVEGSSVVKGSNWATPTQSTEEMKNIEGAGNPTPDNEPPKGTQTDAVKTFINPNLY